MGYDVHITRAEEWAESSARPVTLEEWLAYVGADKEMQREDRVEAVTLQGNRLGYESPGLACWLGSAAAARAAGCMPWFDWRSGQIAVKNPDREALQKMHRIAQSLAAQVVGDDGERYDAFGECQSESRAVARRSWWRALWPGRRKAGTPASDAQAGSLAFAVGDRVIDPWSNIGTVIAIDAGAAHGLGLVRVRFDDGRALDFSLVAHGLRRLG